MLVPDALSIFDEIYNIAKGIYDHVQKIKANQAQSKRLAERVNIIIDAVRYLEDLPKQRQESYSSGLISLKKCLSECLTFINKFTHSSKWYKYILKAGIYQSRFAELYQQLQSSIAQLSLGLDTQKLINQEQDRADQAADQKFIKDNQEEILKLNKKANKKLIKLDKKQDEYYQVLQRQGESIKEKILVLQELTPKKPPIDPRHIISYFDLSFVEKITEGSFGKIYKGHYCKEMVVIKTLEGERTETDQEQFIREVGIMSRLHHKNITQFYGACLESKRACIVMEYMENGSLYKILGDNKMPLSLKQRQQIALDIVHGLYYLHKRRVLHRDLKSANVLIDLYRQAKLTDFGLAKISSNSITSIDSRSHDLQWQAPECLKEKGYYLPQSDIYSLGTILWELFTGQRPYKKYESVPEKFIKAILDGEREEIPESVPAVYAGLIRDCWKEDPSQRPKLKTILQQIEAQINQSKSDNTMLSMAKNYNAQFALLSPRSTSPTPDQYYQQAVQHELQAYCAYQKAADKGYQEAFSHLGAFFLTGRGGITLNKQKAYEYLFKAAENQHAGSMLKVAKLLEQGSEGLEKNVEKALYWYQKAIEMGDSYIKIKAQAKYEKLKALLVNSANFLSTNNFKLGQ